MTLQSKENDLIDETIEIRIRGGENLKLNIRADVIIPNVEVVQEAISFLPISYNERAKEKLTFRNKSTLPAIVIIDLNDKANGVPLFKEFKMELTDDFKGDETILKNLAIEQDQEKSVKKDLDSNSEDNSVSFEEKFEEQNVKPEEFRHFEITIKANSEVDFWFFYSPLFGVERDKTTTRKFILQCKLKGVGTTAGLTRPVQTTIVKSKIALSNDTIEFPKTFIMHGQDRAYSIQETIISNEENKRNRWMIETSEIDKEKIFMCLDKEGELDENAQNECKIRFKFSPSEPKSYPASVYLHLFKSNGESYSYKEIKLIGEGTQPRIYFDKRELIMPVVPLNTVSRLPFKLRNEGFDNIRLEHKIISHIGNLNFKVDYLEGQNIGILKSELKMEISCIFNKPISFSVTLLFFDEDGNEAPITVVGASDNCLFSNFNFMWKNSAAYLFRDEGESVFWQARNPETDKVVDFDENSVGSNASNNTKSSILRFSKKDNEIQKKNCDYLFRYLDSMFPGLISHFPNSLVENTGEAIYRLINLLTGVDVPGKVSKVDDDTEKGAFQLRNQYAELIRFLQQQGAFLNTVIPEYMMSFIHFKKYAQKDGKTSQILEPNWIQNVNKYRNIHNFINRECWITITYQILKIFYLSRVSLKALKNSVRHLPQEIIDIPNKLPHSNIYSQSEMCLIKWLRITAEISTGETQKIVEFFDYQQTSQIIISLLHAYFNKSPQEIAKSKKESIFVSYDRIAELLKRDFGVVTHMLHEEHFIKANSLEMMLFYVMLFQNLQHFIPLDTIIFKATLGEPEFQSITIENKSQKLIEYDVKKEGSDDFFFKSTADLKVAPGSEINFIVGYKSRFSKEQLGKIIFINKGDSLANQAAPLVYNLKSETVKRESLGKFGGFTCPLYQKNNPIKIRIRSPFQEKLEWYNISFIIHKKTTEKSENKLYTSTKKKKKEEKKDVESEYNIFSIHGEPRVKLDESY